MAVAPMPIPVDGVTLNQSGAAPTLDYSTSRPKLLFDAGSAEYCYIEIQLPSIYSSAPILKLQYSMASATSGGVVMGCDVMAVTIGEAVDMDSDSYDTVNVVTDTVPGTAGRLAGATITLTNFDSAEADDYIVLRLYRVPDNAGDDATGDLELWTITFEFTTA